MSTRKFCFVLLSWRKTRPPRALICPRRLSSFPSKNRVPHTSLPSVQTCCGKNRGWKNHACGCPDPVSGGGPGVFSGGDRLLNMLLQGGFEFLGLLWCRHCVAWLGGLELTKQQEECGPWYLATKQRENCACGRHRVIRVRFLFC